MNKLAETDRWLTLRIPTELLDRIKLAAKQDDRTVSYIVRRALKQQFPDPNNTKSNRAA